MAPREATQAKYFEYAREISRYVESAPDSDLATTNIIPQYILVGDQSSGKTTILCRLAGLPLGFTANGTGTRRPFEYTFIHDESCSEPRVTVDSKPVDQDVLLKVMASKNGSSGFRSQSVSVKIEWKEIAMDMIIVDMPGMKDGEDEPEKMVLERLEKYPDATPVVVLEPRDLGSAHYIFKVLQTARPQRSNGNIIALVNKCDMQMSGNGEWMSHSSWEEWWRGAQSKGFMHLFCVGWPDCTDRSSSDSDLQKGNLIRSFKNEEELIQSFTAKVESARDAADVMGLRRFQRCLHQHQTAKMLQFVQISGPKIEAEVRRLEQQLDAVDLNLEKTLKDSKHKLVCSWCQEGSHLLEGRFDPHFQAGKTRLGDDLQSLLEDIPRFKELPFAHQHGQVAEQLARNAMLTNLLPAMRDASMSFIGKAALERDVQLIFSWGFLCVFRQKVMEFTEEFVKNIHSRSQEDTGNMVVREFTARVMAQTLHPLTDVLCVLVWRHVETALMATFDNMEKEGRGWKQLFETFKDTTLLDEFHEEVKKFSKELVKGLNKDLHERLDDQAGALQGGYHSSARGRTLASNTAGIQGLDMREQVHDQPAQPSRRRSSGGGPGCFATIGLLCSPPAPSRADEMVPFQPPRIPQAVQPAQPGESGAGAAERQAEFRSQARRFLSLASEELAKTGKEGEQVARLADLMQAGLGLMPERVHGRGELQEVFTRLCGPASWKDDAHCLSLTPNESDPAVLLRSIPFAIRPGTVVKVVLQAMPEYADAAPADLAGRHAEVQGLPARFAGIAIRGIAADTWLASKSIAKDNDNHVLTLSHELRELVDEFVHLELIATCGMRLGVVSVAVGDSPALLSAIPTPQKSTSAASRAAHADPNADDGVLSLMSQHMDAMKPFYHTMQEMYQVPKEKQTRGMDLQKLNNDTAYELIWQLVEFRRSIDKCVSRMRKAAIDGVVLRMFQAIGDDCLQQPLKCHKKQLKRLKKTRTILQNAAQIRQSILGDSDSTDDEAGAMTL